jgi:type I restriction enzyme S subunit
MIEGLQPYAEYKKSGLPWLDTIPKHWGMIPNRAVMQDQREVVGENAPDYTLLSLTLRGVIARDMVNPKGKFPAQFNTYKVVRPNDFVFCLFDIDETPRGVGLSNQRGMITGAYDVFSPRQGINPRYLYYYYLFVDEGKLMKPLYTGLRKTIQRGTFASLKAPCPPPDEQAAIVRFLDHANRKIDGFIRAKRKLIALLGEQKQAIIHRAVTRGLDPNAPLKPSGIPWLGDIPRHWEVSPLKGVCNVQSGVTLGKTYTNTALAEFPYLRVANVQAGRLALESVKTLRLPAAEAKRSMLQVGDVLMTEGGDPDKLGRGCVWNGEIENCIHQNHVFAVRPSLKRMRPHYLAALLATHYAKTYFLRTAKQTTNLASTNKTTIGQFRVLLPSIEEQDAILAGLSSELSPLDTAIARTEREIALMQEYRTRLTADVVTGKLDVRPAAAKLPAAEAEPEPAVPTDEDSTEEAELEAAETE